MSTAAKIAWDDTILPFQLDRSDIRGRVARLDGTLNGILSQHDYPPMVQALVADAALLTALIGQAIKLRWKLSLQIRGNGPIRLIATDYYAPGKDGSPAQMRAYASFDREALPEAYTDPFPLIGQGFFAVLIDQGEGTEPYQGVTPLVGASLADCAATYFAQSEQLPTQFALAAALSTEPGQETEWRAGGVMLQMMPKASALMAKEPEAADGLLAQTDFLEGDEGENWTRAVTLLETVELSELIGPLVGPDMLLHRLYHEEVPRVFDAQPIRFGCTCGPEKVEQTMSIYSAKDIEKMTNDDGMVTADCQFCGAHYEFHPKKLGFEAKS